MGIARSRPTLPHSGLDAYERHAGIMGTFTVSRSLEGRNVAIVDDVITTEATVNSLAGALRDAGALTVEA
ncbi:MAG TPA: hypothetical protein QF901_08335 [Gammaproteobacteria bacterium]|nr:hypothetical protein [Gammaproteobacteria bacterium]